MKKKSFLPLLGLIAPLILCAIPMPSAFFIAAVIALLILGLQIAIYQSNTNDFISHLFVSTSFALIIKAGFAKINYLELGIYLLLFTSLLIHFFNKKERSQLLFKVVLLVALTLPLLSIYLHFGSLLVYLPIAALTLAVLAKRAAHYRDLNWLWSENPIFAILLALGIISSLVYIGIFSLFSIIFSTVIVLAAVSYIFYSYTKKKERQRALIVLKEEEKKLKEKEIIEARQKKEEDRNNFLEKILSDNFEYYYQDLKISNFKKQVIWGPILNDAITLCKEILSSSFVDYELQKIILFIDSLLNKIDQEKNAPEIYAGENELKHKLLNLKNMLEK